MKFKNSFSRPRKSKNLIVGRGKLRLCFDTLVTADVGKSRDNVKTSNQMARIFGGHQSLRLLNCVKAKNTLQQGKF